MYLWRYHEENFNAEGFFQPKEKYKIKLSVLTFDPIGKKEQTFPGKTKTKDERAIKSEQEVRFKKYDNSADFKTNILTSARTGDITELLAFKTKLPNEG